MNQNEGINQLTQVYLDSDH